MNIPIVAVVDTNANPEDVPYPVPGQRRRHPFHPPVHQQVRRGGQRGPEPQDGRTANAQQLAAERAGSGGRARRARRQGKGELTWPVDMEAVKKLREQTGISILECKKAVEEAGGDLEKAAEILRKKGFEKAKAKSAGTTNQGAIGSYIHMKGKIGVLVELRLRDRFRGQERGFPAVDQGHRHADRGHEPASTSRKRISPPPCWKRKRKFTANS